MVVLYIFIVHNFELESENSHPVLVGERLLHRVVVDVPVDQVQLKWVPGNRDFCGYCSNRILHIFHLQLWKSHGEISSKLYGDWLWDENFKFCLIFTHFSRFSPFSGYIWWNNTLSSLENFSLNSILFFLFLMSHPDNGGFLKIAQKRDSISKKTSFCIMVINTDHQESWFLSVGHPLCALR